MFTTLPANAPSRGNKYRVFKREADGFVHGIGIVMAANKHNADYRARQYFGRNLSGNEAVWAEEMEERFAL
jgi:hypothetical protein